MNRHKVKHLIFYRQIVTREDAERLLNYMVRHEMIDDLADPMKPFGQYSTARLIYRRSRDMDRIGFDPVAHFTTTMGLI